MTRDSQVLTYNQEDNNYDMSEVDDLVLVDMNELSGTYNEAAEETESASVSKLSNYIMRTDKGILINVPTIPTTSCS